MNAKKLMALLLSAIMIIGIMVACGPAPVENPPEQPPQTSAPDQPKAPDQPPASPEPPPPPASFNSKTDRATFVVGTPAMNGDFIDGFGNSSYDLYIKVLTGGVTEGGYYMAYYQTADGQIALNPTVLKDVQTSFDGDGNKTFTLTIWDDLKWNDGTTIYAKDFVAALLIYASPEFAEVGVTSTAGDGLLGYQEFVDGDTPYFLGAQVLGDFQYSLTIDAKELPYFWETSYVAHGPIPMFSWLPDNEIVCDENGARFANDITADCERIASTERFKPTVSYGPYTFIDFDGSTVTLERNPHFKSDQFGNKPVFEYVIQMEVPQETDVDMVLSGDLDLVTGVIEGSKIEKARASEYAVAHSYLRAGYGYIGFACDWGVTADKNVRWAIAHIIDRNAVIDHVLEGYGGTVDAAFGMAQWTYQQKRRELAQQLVSLAFNLDKANDFLDQTEWVFEADGSTPFDRAKANAAGSYMRHNSKGEMLVVRHLSASITVGGVIESETLKNSPLVGMKYEVTQGDFNALLDHYYEGYAMGADRYYNAFNLATNFTAVDDKYWTWHSDLVGTWMNAEQLSDPELDSLCMELRRLDPSEVDKFADIWVKFQVRWQQLLPQFPLYSNEYFDIFNAVVTQVPTSPYANYCDVICQVAKHP